MILMRRQLTTISKFFEKQLECLEIASRIIYIYRNTLVYRLDKLQKSTGLDLSFLLKMQLPLNCIDGKYMKYMETLDY